MMENLRKGNLTVPEAQKYAIYNDGELALSQDMHDALRLLPVQLEVYAIFLVVEGKARIEINGKAYEISKEDLFICPSRETMYTDPQPDGEYGMAIRMFNSKEKCYDMAYACEKYICNLRFIKEGDKLIGTVTDDPSSKWVFADIKKDTFHWQNITVLESGEWQVNSNVFEEKSFIEKATDSGKEYLWKCGDI